MSVTGRYWKLRLENRHNPIEITGSIYTETYWQRIATILIVDDISYSLHFFSVLDCTSLDFCHTLSHFGENLIFDMYR